MRKLSISWTFQGGMLIHTRLSAGCFGAAVKLTRPSELIDTQISVKIWAHKDERLKNRFKHDNSISWEGGFQIRSGDFG